MTNEEMEQYIAEHKVCCPICGKHNLFELLVELLVRALFAEPLVLHLLELDRAENKVPRRDLVAERLSDLRDPEGNLLDLGFNEEPLRFKDHDKLAHYAKEACDIQYDFPMGWSELNGIHNRTDYDLSRHLEYSGKSGSACRWSPPRRR